MRTFVNDHYEQLTMSSSALVSMMSGVLYFVTTQTAAVPERLSGIGANMWANWYFAKVSIDFLVNLCSQAQHPEDYVWQRIKAGIILLAAAGCYIPQIMIAMKESTGTVAFKSFAAISTLISGATLYTTAMMQIVKMLVATKNFFMQTTPFYLRQRCGKMDVAELALYQDRAATLENIDLLIRMVQFGQYRDPAFQFDLDNPVATALKLAEGVQPPAINSLMNALSFLGNGLRILASFITGLLMVYGAFAYTFSTEDSLRKDFNWSALASVLNANVLMFLQYTLAMTGGYSVMTGVFETIANAIQFGAISNDFKVGGTFGVIAMMLSPFFSALLTCLSGFTSKMLFEKHYQHSLMRAVAIPHAAVVIDYSARTFNGIYDLKTCYWFILYAVNHFGKSESMKKDQEYLQLVNALILIRAKIAKTSVADLNDTLREKGVDDLRARDFFKRRPADDGRMHHVSAPLMANMSPA